jgi:diaminopimelate decarboxylase
MYVSDCIDINSQGHLTIGGCDTTHIAKEFGTPVYVMDEDEIRKNCRKFVESINEYYGGNGMALYASKAFCCKEICRIMAQEGMGLDVVSGGELFTATSVGFPAERIYFHGNNKTSAELKQAIDYGVGKIIVDNILELETLNELASAAGKKEKIIMRIKPGIDAHTHEFIKTGQIDSKFGFALETGEAMEGVLKAVSMPNIELVGLHCHIGSQIFDLDPFELAARVMLDFMAEIKQATGLELSELNLGGGFGIKYKKTDRPRPFKDYMKKVSEVINEYSKKLKLKTPSILVEPGRAIVGAAGLTLYTVGSVKSIPDVRTYISVDGGMGDNPRYILYQSNYEIICANRAAEKRSVTVTVAGKFCESGDIIQEWTHVQPVKTGDILAVLSTGAYNYSMASHYNRIGRPPVVMVKGGEPRIIIRGDSYEDIIMNDI